ncbi:MAG TPA: hypothetical protein VFA68_17950 [Terriglobales bacterium]|nr:hypothetical protein [Terriglobales bacterium]
MRLFLFAALLAASSACFAQPPTGKFSAETAVFRTIDFPGAINTLVDGINNKGMIVGCYTDKNANTHGFTFVNGTILRYDHPRSSFNGAYGINDNGVIVGTFSTTLQLPYQSINGKFKQVPIIQGFAADINNSGVIVGSYYDVCCTLHGYLYAGGQFTFIDYPGATRTFLDGINSAGVASGFWEDATFAHHGFTWNNGTFTSFDVPGAISTSAIKINSSNTIVGYYRDSSSVDHGFMLQNGIYTTVDFPGAASTQINAINDLGMIVGDYVDASGVMHGFLGHP